MSTLAASYSFATTSVPFSVACGFMSTSAVVRQSVNAHEMQQPPRIRVMGGFV